MPCRTKKNILHPSFVQGFTLFKTGEKLKFQVKGYVKMSKTFVIWIFVKYVCT